jgi:NADH-quinone oxidoreductase subunit G
MRQIEKADFILAIGADPVNEAPMLALAMRQAFRNDAAIAVMDPRPVFLPFEFEHLPVAPGDLEPCLNTIMKGAIDRSAAEKMGKEALQFYDATPSEYSPEPTLKNRMGKIIEKLKQSHYPVLVCGTAIVQESTPSLVADNTRLLRAVKDRAGLFYAMPGANAFGAALLSSQEGSLVDVIESIEKGGVKALMLVESDPFWSFHDQERLKKAIEKLELLLVMDYLPSEAAKEAHIFLPTRTLFETETSFLNQEGRIQFTAAAHHGGIPISQISAGNHPPRTFRHDIPGEEPEPTWKILAKLADAMPMPRDEILPRSRSELWVWITKEFPAFAHVQNFDEQRSSVRVNLGLGTEKPFSSYGPSQSEIKRQQDDGLDLLLTDWTFGTEELAAYSRYIHQVEKSPCLFMHPSDALRAGIAGQERCTLRLDGGSLDVELRVVENMAPGVMVMPRHRQLAWQKLKKWPVRVAFDQIAGSRRTSA